jgi:FkbM family methyltransferase
LSRLIAGTRLLGRLRAAERRVEKLEAKLEKGRSRRRRDRQAHRKTRRALERLRKEPDGAVPARTRLKYKRAEILLASPSRQAFERRRAVQKEPFTARWIEQMAQGAVLYDVGANVGPYSLLAAVRGVRVIAFEPAYANFDVLHQNVLLNSASELVTPLPIALGENTELGELGLSSLEPGSALHAMRGETTELEEPLHRQAVLAYRLDDVIEQFALPEPEHLKLDADGSELAVLRGATTALGRESLRTALVEVHDEQRQEIETLLLEHGLEPVERHERRARTGTLMPFSYIRFARDGADSALGAEGGAARVAELPGEVR